jgi:demethylmenaquinone methyltransferase/2-methoxy-6-polyprenyl-1,4-benzoquinol methylase
LGGFYLALVAGALPDYNSSMPAERTAWNAELLESPHEVPDKAGRVRRMFDAIAPRYELINTLFSAGRDAAWRRRAVALARVGPEDDVLDVACGTGDFARAFARACPRSVVGCDFAHEMLLRATGRMNGVSRFCEGDGLRLPFQDGAFSIVCCAFGVRNFQDLSAGLEEMHRVLRPGGRCVILEFTRPGNPLVRRMYEWYSGRLMPGLASVISGDRTGAYRYLPRSIVSFPDADQSRAELRRAGFDRIDVQRMTFGVVTTYVAWRT